MTTGSVTVRARVEEIEQPREYPQGGGNHVEGDGSDSALFSDQASYRRVRTATIAGIVGVQVVWVAGLAYELARLFG
jgi:hypothetical protein